MLMLHYWQEHVEKPLNANKFVINKLAALNDKLRSSGNMAGSVPHRRQSTGSLQGAESKRERTPTDSPDPGSMPSSDATQVLQASTSARAESRSGDRQKSKTPSSRTGRTLSHQERTGMRSRSRDIANLAKELMPSPRLRPTSAQQAISLSQAEAKLSATASGIPEPRRRVPSAASSIRSDDQQGGSYDLETALSNSYYKMHMHNNRS